VNHDTLKKCLRIILLKKGERFRISMLTILNMYAKKMAGGLPSIAGMNDGLFLRFSTLNVSVSTCLFL